MHTPHRDSLIDSNDPQYSRWYYTFETSKAIRRLLWPDYVPWHLDPTTIPVILGPIGIDGRCLSTLNWHLCGPRDFVVGTSYSTDQSFPSGPTSQSITWNRALKPSEWKQHPGRAYQRTMLPACIYFFFGLVPWSPPLSPLFQPVITSHPAYC